MKKNIKSKEDLKMNEFKIKISARDLRKAAFAVTFGLTVGKAVGDLVSAGISGIMIGVTKNMAKCGNKTAQKACEESGIDYAKEMKEDPRR